MGWYLQMYFMSGVFDAETPRRTAIYIRVSTEEQDIDGYGLEAQKGELLNYVNNNKSLKLITHEDWIYSDTHTGSDVNRVSLNQLREDVKAGKFDAVLVWKIDRLSRCLQHLLFLFEEFKAKNVSFISMKENIDFKGAIGSLIFQIFGAIAQFERELIKDRTMMGKIASAKQGNYTGTYIPYGYAPVYEKKKKGKKLALVPREQQWVQQMFEWYVYEKLGDGQIANRLNEKSVPKSKWVKDRETGVWHQVPSLGKWTTKMVTAIITNPLYAGTHYPYYKDENGNELPPDKWIVVQVPKCIDMLLYRQAENARRGRVGGSTDTPYMLSGKLRDMTLDSPKNFVGAQRSKGGFSYRRKQFDKDGKHYPVFEVVGEAIDEVVWKRVMFALKNPEQFIKHYLSREFANPDKLQRLADHLEELKMQRINKDLEIGKIEIAYQQGVYDLDKMNAKVSTCNKQTAAIDEQIKKVEEELSLISSQGIEVQKLREAAKQVKYRLDHLDPKQKKIICDLFVDRVELRRTENPHAKNKMDRWIKTIQVFLRFNPDKLFMPVTRVEPSSVSSKPKGEVTHPQDKNFGGPGGI